MERSVETLGRGLCPFEEWIESGWLESGSSKEGCPMGATWLNNGTRCITLVV